MAEQTLINKNSESENRGCGGIERATIKALCKKVGITDDEIKAEM